MNNLIERKDFVSGDVQPATVNKSQLHNILTRDDFVEDECMKEEFKRLNQHLKISEGMNNAKLLFTDKLVLRFEEFVKQKKVK